MGRICGFVGSTPGLQETAEFLRRCYPVALPDPFRGAYRVAGDAALGAEGDGSLHATPDERYTCLVDGELFLSRADRQALRRDGEPDPPSTPAHVLLNYYLANGIDRFDRLPAGIVFGIFDAKERRLILGRDRFGMKRLYYCRAPGGLRFASSLTGLVTSPGVARRISREGLVHFLSYGFIPSPLTIYEGVFTLDPGAYLDYRDDDLRVDAFHPMVPTRFAFHDTRDAPEDELADRLDGMLQDAIQRRLPGGPTVCTYLSGGLDTSLLCALLKQHAGRTVVAFTLGSNDPACDEVRGARAIAEHLKVDDHHSYYIKEDDFLEALHALPSVYGQPFADISAIPNYVIARQVARYSDAVFAGDGPDFLYGGVDFRRVLHYYRRVPYVLRVPLSAVLDLAFRTLYRGWVSPNIHLAELLRQPEFFWIFHKKFKSTELERLLGTRVDTGMFWLRRFLEERQDIPLYERLRLAFLVSFGIQGVLCKGTEIHDALRLGFLCPYYDPDPFDFVQFLPTKYKTRRGQGKYLHSKLLHRYIPPRLLQRPKHGFIINYNECGLGALHGLTDRYLCRRRLAETGLFDPEFALACVKGYYDGDTRMGPLLWTLLVFEMWRDAFLP